MKMAGGCEMKTRTALGRVLGTLLLPACLAACGSITAQDGSDGGGTAGALGAPGDGGASGTIGAGGVGGGGGRGGTTGAGGVSVTGTGGVAIGGRGGSTAGTTGAAGAPNPDASTQKDGSASDGPRPDATACMPGDRRCEGNTPVTCDANGVWQPGAACSNVCSAGSCVGVCSPGAKMCVGNIPEACDSNGLWQSAPACTYVCHQGSCAGVCLPGARQCSATGVPQSCSADGAWVDSGPACPFVCTQGSCTGVCTPGSATCNGNIPQSCTSTGDWQSGTSCPYVCSNGQCAGSCTPGAHQCAGNQPQNCDAGGTWQNGDTCPYVCSAGSCTGSCVPGATQCVSGQKQICDTTGNWQNTASPPMQLLANPGFDSGHVAWVESTLSTSTVITPDSALTSIKSQSPSYVAWLGGYANAQDDIHQTVSIPAGVSSISLTFYYAIFTAENTSSGAFDMLDVYTYTVADGTFSPVATFSNLNATTTWQRFSITLPSSLAGQKVEIGFQATTDLTKNTNFFIDTVSLDVAGCGP
jgi:hypothetical protein